MRDLLVVFSLMLLAAIVFVTGIDWGLPARSTDAYLFGSRTPWTGQEILSLAPARDDAVRGADVDINPLDRSAAQIHLNATDAQRAEIVRRYRLYSHQPDEMITLMSLARIRENHGDPRLYQYGGLWIYPVGVLLKISSMLGFIELRGDQAFYLDHPEAFGRFYVVARLYSAAWGVLGVWAVWWLARRWSGSKLLAAGAAACYVLLPVVVNMAHEAKPHLPGAVLMLLAVMVATKFVETGRVRWALLAGAGCGAATGMVLSAAPVFLVLVVMIFFCQAAPFARRWGIVLAAAAVGVVVYCLTNPFVPINLLTNQAALQSNLGNTSAMYEAGRWGEGMTTAGLLVSLGATPVIAIGGAVAGVWLLARRVFQRQQCDDTCAGRGEVGWLLAAPAIVLAIQFAALAAGKPPEYARFAIFIDVALVVALFVGIGSVVRNTRVRAILCTGVLVLPMLASSKYVLGFASDQSLSSSRRHAADVLAAKLPEDGSAVVHLSAEPAPYSCPPLNLFNVKIILNRSGDLPTPADARVSVRPNPLHPISWADVVIDTGK